MTLAELIPLAINASIALIVLSVGLDARLDDLTFLLRRPGLLARSLLAMNILTPLFAAAVAAVFGLHRAVEIALITLAVSPVPPFLPTKEMKAGAARAYVIGLLAITALVAIVFVPVMVEALGRAFGEPAHVSAASIARVVVTSVLAPLIVGMIVRLAAPALAERIAKPVYLFAIVLLIGAMAPVLFVEWSTIVSLIGNGTIIAIAACVVFGLVAGHLLGAPDPGDRTALALSAATRHPGVALAIAAANPADVKPVLAAVLLYIIAGGLVSMPYVKWRTRQHAAGAAGSRADAGTG